MRKKIEEIKGKMQKQLEQFRGDESGMGVIEVVLIILVLVGLALVFKNQLASISGGLYTSLKKQVSHF